MSRTPGAGRVREREEPAAVELYEGAHPPRRLEVVRGMGHGFTSGGLAAVDQAVTWVATQ